MELDYIAAIALIQKGTYGKHPYAMVLARVHDLLRRNWQVLIRHMYCNANYAMDCLANVGHSLNLGVCYFLSPTSCLGTILRDDLAGLVLFWTLAPFIHK